MCVAGVQVKLIIIIIITIIIITIIIITMIMMMTIIIRRKIIIILIMKATFIRSQLLTFRRFLSRQRNQNRTLIHNEANKHLGVDDSNGTKRCTMKEKIRKEHYRKVRPKSELNVAKK